MSETSPDKLPSVPPPNLGKPMTVKPTVRSALIFLAKSIVFTIVFWTLWLYGLRPIFYGESDKSSQSAQTADDRMRERYEEQITASEQALKRQAELLNRWEKVIERWEALAPKAK